MGSWKETATSVAAIGLCMTGSTAIADVTAQDVWQNWKDYMASSGYEVEAEENRSGDTLTVADLTMSLDIPEEDASVSFVMGEVSFTDNGDGTVSVSIPPVMPMNVMVDGPDGEDVDVALEYRSTALAMNVSGDPDNMTYTYSAAELAMSLVSVMAEGTAADIGTAEVTLANLAGTTVMKQGDLLVSDQKMTTGAVAYNLDITDPDGGGGRMVINGGAESMDFAGTASLPPDMDASNMAAMLSAGFAMEGEFRYKNGAADFNFQEEGQIVQGSSQSAGGDLQVTMSEDQLRYGGSAQDMQISMAGGDIPFPVELAMQEMAFNLLTPVSKGQEVQDFALGLTLGDFTMSDMIWGIFDPGGELPRDPATLAFDLTGKARLFFDLMDPEQMEEAGSGSEMPGELHQLDLNSLTLRVAGAELTGSGGFVFDNTDLETFDGMPAPDGAVDLRLEGGNGLLDRLIAMGLVPEQQAQGMRMMMGLFAVPGDGEDTLTSRIEVKSNGQILANGQRLK